MVDIILPNSPLSQHILIPRHALTFLSRQSFWRRFIDKGQNVVHQCSWGILGYCQLTTVETRPSGQLGKSLNGFSFLIGVILFHWFLDVFFYYDICLIWSGHVQFDASCSNLLWLCFGLSGVFLSGICWKECWTCGFDLQVRNHFLSFFLIFSISVIQQACSLLFTSSRVKKRCSYIFVA